MSSSKKVIAHMA